MAGNQSVETYLGCTPAELEARARKLITEGVEGPKLDFKEKFPLRTAEEKTELAKDVSAIANTDDERLGDVGYVILGAKRGQLVGGIDSWKGTTADHFSAHLTDVLKERLAPVPQIHFIPFEDPAKGAWGVIVIPSSTQQPHVITRDFPGKASKGDCFVRINDTTHRAGAADHARFRSKGPPDPPRRNHVWAAVASLAVVVAIVAATISQGPTDRRLPVAQGSGSARDTAANPLSVPTAQGNDASAPGSTTPVPASRLPSPPVFVSGGADIVVSDHALLAEAKARAARLRQLLGQAGGAEWLGWIAQAPSLDGKRTDVVIRGVSPSAIPAMCAWLVAVGMARQEGAHGHRR
ncbi:MAG: ATP-binding protein [Deltaproteobacteria bacterium]|nr:ATP-binding protein [Deltaproteobacteria bacterium]